MRVRSLESRVGRFCDPDSRLRTPDSNRQIVPNQHQNGGLGHHQVLAFFERDFYGCLAEKDRVVADLRLHPPAAPLSSIDLPRLIVEGAEVRDRGPGTSSDDQTGLYLLGVDGGGGKIESNTGALIAVLWRDEHAIAYHQQLLLGKLHQPFPLARLPSAVSASAWCTVIRSRTRSRRVVVGSRRLTSSPTRLSDKARPRGDAREMCPASMSIISARTT